MKGKEILSLGMNRLYRSIQNEKLTQGDNMRRIRSMDSDMCALITYKSQLINKSSLLDGA
jgi:adenylate cyclase class IV